MSKPVYLYVAVYCCILLCLYVIL